MKKLITLMLFAVGCGGTAGNVTEFGDDPELRSVGGLAVAGSFASGGSSTPAGGAPSMSEPGGSAGASAGETQAEAGRGGSEVAPSMAGASSGGVAADGGAGAGAPSSAGTGGNATAGTGTAGTGPGTAGGPTCTPKSWDQACAGRSCGKVPNGCGGEHRCGSCPGLTECNAVGTCGPSCDALALECGTHPGYDLDCGSCGAGQDCGVVGVGKCSTCAEAANPGVCPSAFPHLWKACGEAPAATCRKPFDQDPSWWCCP